MTYAGVISGTGSLTKRHRHADPHRRPTPTRGGTTISAGTLQIGNGGTDGQRRSATSTDNAALAFNRSDTVTYGGVISGTGRSPRRAAGTLILTGANTYTGGTTISAGTLQIGNGGTTGSVGSATSPTTPRLVFNRSDTRDLGGVISGTGALTQAGPAR